MTFKRKKKARALIKEIYDLLIEMDEAEQVLDGDALYCIYLRLGRLADLYSLGDVTK